MNRPAVLALPRATTLRMVALVVALVVSGLFVGTALHNALLGDSWSEAARACAGPDGLLPTDPGCMADAERRRALVAVLAALGVALLAVAGAYVAAARVRRRARLLPVDARFASAVRRTAELAADEGVPAPRVLVAKRLAAPFCLGMPGAYSVAIPQALAVRASTPTFTALVGHEVAHLRHHDVALSWLGRTAGYVLLPLLAIPVLAALVGGEPLLALDIAWRTAVLGAVVWIVPRELMWARELDADARAAARPGVLATLERLLVKPAPTGLRRLRAWHPSHARRRAALADPLSLTRMGVADGLVLAFLVALAMPLVVNVLNAALLGDPLAAYVRAFTALLLGPLFGATVGIGLWRHELASRTDGRSGGVRRVASGVLVGALLGTLVSPAGTGLGVAGDWSLLVVPVALAGATVLVGGLGRRWVRAPRRTPRRVGVPAALTGALLVTGVLAVSGPLPLFLDAGWAMTLTYLTSLAALGPATVLAVVLAVIAALPVRDGPLPAWWGVPGLVLPRPRGGIGAGTAAGLAAGAAAWLARGAAADDVDLYRIVEASLLGAALAAGVAVLVPALLGGPEGAGRGVLAGPLAALMASAVFLASIVVTAPNPLPVAGHVLAGGLAVGFLVAPVAALAALVPLPPVRSGVVTALVAAVLAGTAGGAVVAERATLVPDPWSGVPHDAPVVPVTRDEYRNIIAPEIVRRHAAVKEAFDALDAEGPPGPVAAARVRDEMLAPMQDLLTAVDDIVVTDPALVSVHDHIRNSIRFDIEGYRMLADALDADDVPKAYEAGALLDQGTLELGAWVRGVDGL